MDNPPPANHDSLLTRTDWLLIAVLVALVLPLRIWLLCNTEVTARDSIGYIRYALQFERKSWQEVLNDNHQHPGYPALVYLASQPLRAWGGETTPENMELACQLVSFFASLVLILPMYCLGRQFLVGSISFWGTLLYQYLPISAQHLSDGISEPAYLVFLVSGLLFMARAMRTRAILDGVACGCFTGLAYLTRPEGLLILPAFALTLIVLQSRSEWRCGWGRLASCGAAMLLAAGCVGSIYVCATGKLTNKPSPQETMKLVVQANGAIDSREPNAGKGSLFAVAFQPSDHRSVRLGQGVWGLAQEIVQGFFYGAAIPAVLGFWWSFGTLRRHPGFWALAIYGVIHATILVALAMSVFYISDRHVMIFVLGGCFYVIVGLRELPRRLLTWWKLDEAKTLTPSAWQRWCLSPAVWFGVLLVTLIGVGLPKATQRLHGARVGNHQAGLWLAEHANLQEGDIVLDDHAWSNFFAGALFLEGREPKVPGDIHPTCYVVTTRSRDPQIERIRQAGAVGKDAKVVFAWPDVGDVASARVVVYAQPRNPVTNPWKKK